MNKHSLVASCGLILALLVSGAAWSQSNIFADPLDTAAFRVRSPATQSISALVAAGDRLVGVGMRGMIVTSVDQGKTWQQADVPQQSDLTAVSFAGVKLGWAVGHEGVILHTQDGGKRWMRQLDGRMAKTQFTAYYRQRVDAGEAAMLPFLKDLERNFAKGPTLPYLDVFFSDEKTGFAVGSFGALIATTDGGATWKPWSDHVDNPGFLNLNAVRKIGADWFIAGEKGTIFKLDPAKGQFQRIQTDYAGSFFGIVGNERSLYAYGLRGTVYHSADGGTTWQSVSLPVPALVSAGIVLADGRVLLVTVAGMLWVSQTNSPGFSPLPIQIQDLPTSVLALDGSNVLVGGLRGLSVHNLQVSPAAAVAATANKLKP